MWVLLTVSIAANSTFVQPIVTISPPMEKKFCEELRRNVMAIQIQTDITSESWLAKPRCVQISEGK